MRGRGYPRRALCLLLCAAIALTCSMWGGGEADAAASGMIRVKISVLGSPTSISMKTTGGYTVNGTQIPSGSAVKVTGSGSSVSLAVGGASMGTWSSLTLKRTGAGTTNGVTFTSPSAKNLYCGDLTFTASGGAITTVLSIYVETYTYGVVGYELSNTFPTEALKAFAVAARTFAMCHQSSSGTYDVTDTASHQVFRGYNSAQTNVHAAVDATRGQYLMYGGNYVQVFYSASNGGQTESNYSLWGTAKLPYLNVKLDPYDLESASAPVKSARLPKSPSASDPLNASLNSALLSALSDKMAAAGVSGGSVTKILSLTPHTPKSGAGSLTYQYIRFDVRVSVGSKSADLSCDLATYGLLENMFSLGINGGASETVFADETSDAFYIRFRRNGHAIGMSAWGATCMAQKYGKSYSEILSFYFEGTSLKTLSLADTSSGASQPQTTAAPDPDDGTLSYGDTGDAVLALQTRLKTLGYFTGNPGGNYLEQTVAAVKAYQSAMGLTADGVATPALQKMIFGADEQYETLSYGDSGAKVKKLQTKLKALGYFSGNVGGNYLEKTVAAVKAFQKAMGMTQDGVATNEVQTRLYGGATPTSAPTPPPAATPTPAIQPTAAPTASAYKTLSYGDTGSAVKKLQARLKELGYFSGNIGGNYLTLTVAAVKKYQTALGLTADGVATASLQETLFAAAQPTPAKTVAPTVAPTAMPTTAPTAKPAPNPTSAPSEEYPTLRYGSTGSGVKKLQSKLQELGYFDGSVGGNYLDKTVAAVKRFQKAMGLTADGVATSYVQAVLYETSAEDAPARTPASTAAATKKPDSSSPFSAYAELSPGDSGSAVKKLQSRLKKLGYFGGSIGGNYKSITETAVKAFQKAVGLSQTGVATPETQALLFASGAPSSGAKAKYAYVKSGGATLYQSASPGSGALMTLSAGAKVRVLVKMTGWTRISADGAIGYVAADALSANKP